MLSPYRVLDLSDERGLLCGQILADLGADVIAVEPPGGSSARRIGPFAGDVPGPERSLHWWAYARNKRGITLDLDTDDGRESLRRLVAGADFLIESAPPGEMAARGLGYADLAAINPALVYVSITPFGQDGPKARYAATDLTILAAGGVLVMQGDEDRPPVRVSAPQAWAHAGAEAAGAALVAHHERVRSGRGQHVDVSAQQAVLLAAFSSPLWVPLGHTRKGTRFSGGGRNGPLVFRSVFEARDGYVFIWKASGAVIGPMTRRLMEHIHAEGFCDAATRDKDWIGFGARLLGGEEPPEELDRVTSIVATFAKSRTKDELLRAALERVLMIAPVAGIDELVGSEQLAARDYWQPAEQPERGLSAPVARATLRHPGPFARFSAAPIAYRRRAPAIGEHDDEVLGEPASPPRRASAPAPRAAGTRSDGVSGPPLAGVKVLDLMWAIAGPAATRVLADYGATVVRVESSRRMDVMRTSDPLHGGRPGPENSGGFQNYNAGKLGLTLDLTSEAGRAVIRDLVRWADVVTESFSSKVIGAWGLDYASLREIKPDVIMLSSCLMGQSGPLSTYAGWGFMAAALAGFYGLTGWPDRAPAGTAVALPHDVHGTSWVEGSRFRLSRTPARIERAAPTFGRDNFYVLETILGYDAGRIAELAAAGVLE